MTITEFLEARLFEEERKACGAAHVDLEWRPYWTTTGDHREVQDLCGCTIVPVGVDRPTIEQAAHIAWHDPARVLRGVDAKRRVTAEHGEGAAGECVTCAGQDWPCRTLRMLAEIYSEHPDHLDEWLP